MKKFVVSQESLQKVANYLATKPYHEVFQLLPLFQTPNIEEYNAPETKKEETSQKDPENSKN